MELIVNPKPNVQNKVVGAQFDRIDAILAVRRQLRQTVPGTPEHAELDARFRELAAGFLDVE